MNESRIIETMLKNGYFDTMILDGLNCLNAERLLYRAHWFLYERTTPLAWCPAEN